MADNNPRKPLAAGSDMSEDAHPFFSTFGLFCYAIALMVAVLILFGVAGHFVSSPSAEPGSKGGTEVVPLGEFCRNAAFALVMSLLFWLAGFLSRGVVTKAARSARPTSHPY